MLNGDDPVTTRLINSEEASLATVKIMKTTIDMLLRKPVGTVFRDDDLKGFQAKRIATGVTYHFEYRNGGREAKVKRIKIGRHGNSFTAEQARALAKSYYVAVAVGRDPAGERHKAKTTPTLGEYAETYLEAREKVTVNHPEKATLTLRTINGYKSLIKNHIGPAFGKRKLNAILSDDVQRFHDNLSKTNPTTANRCLEFISSIYGSAAIANHVPPRTNPTFGVKKNKEIKRERFLTKEEMLRLGSAIQMGEMFGIPYTPPEPKPGKKAKHIPKRRPPYVISSRDANALRLLIVTGRRLREWLHVKWTDIDFERCVMLRQTKTGRKHFQLPEPAMEILEQIPQDSIYVFPQHDDSSKPINDLNRAWRAIRKYAGLEGVRLHDIRHNFASVTISGGASLPVLGKILGHDSSKSTERYAHLADDPVRAALEKASAQIDNAIGQTRRGNGLQKEDF